MIELEFQKYVNQIDNTVSAEIQLANKAKKLRIDSNEEIESIFTNSSLDTILAICNIPGLQKYLLGKISQNDNILLLTAEVSKQIVIGRFIKGTKEELIHLALQTAFVLLTRGQSSVPKEYIHIVKIDEKTNHLTLFFTNTIRYVEGTIIGLIVLISDYLRSILHLNRFHSHSDIINRYEEEMTIYLNTIDKIPQFKKEHLRLFLQNIGIELTSEPYERIEVKKYRNLPKLTNHLRMGMNVALEKILLNLKSITQEKLKAGIPEWEWLDGLSFKENFNRREFGLSDIRSTRPLISKSNVPGGFRLRFGSSRVTGFGTVGINPLTMLLTGMLSPGSTIQIDQSDEFFAVNPVSSILGPLIELESGSFQRLSSLKEYEDLKNDISQIWELGDLLISSSDISSFSSEFYQSWTEEWWSLILRKELLHNIHKMSKVSQLTGLTPKDIQDLILNPIKYYPSLDVAFNISKIINIPLHPKYSFNWNEIAISDFILFLENIAKNQLTRETIPPEFVNILKRLGIPFEISKSEIISPILNFFRPYFDDKLDELKNKLNQEIENISVLSLCEDFLGIPIKPLCHERIGVKLIKTEKSEPRIINPPHHIIFPIANHGGSQRDLLKLSKDQPARIRLAERFCPSCNKTSFNTFCKDCKELTIQKYKCREEHVSDSQTCKECGKRAYSTSYQRINVGEMVADAMKKAESPQISRLKGVSFLENRSGIPEHLLKGILRSKYDLSVYKDGTTRYSLTNSPIRIFSPKDANIDIETLHHLGYSHDIHGEDLKDENQLIEIFPYDVIINEDASKYLFMQSKFIDDELIFLYELPPYYRYTSTNNVIGSIIVGVSPISQVGSIGRVIGTTKFKVLFAHPLWHVLKSRYCNGVNDSITLLLDILLNFSKKLYPSSHGGELDTPNYINLMNDWTDLCNISKYKTISLNLSFYQKKIDPISLIDKGTFDSHSLHLNTSFLHVTSNIIENNYFNLFQEKKIDSRVILTLDSLRKIRGVEEGVYVNSILINDFLEKITYSMIRFFQQPFRCKFCKQTFRRIPLSDRCPKCDNRTLEQTLSKGWVLRYFQIIAHLSEKYRDNLSDYTKSWIKFIEINKNNLFDIGPQPTTLFSEYSQG